MTPKIPLPLLVAECVPVGSKCACLETSIVLSPLQSNLIEANINQTFVPTHLVAAI